MRSHSITIRQSIIVCKPRELVWDYTQNFANRPDWDSAIKSAYLLQEEPNRIVKLQTHSNKTMTCYYKHDERPFKSLLEARDISSPFIASADGSWSYEKIGKGTLWSQTNTIAFKQHLLNNIMMPFYKWYFKKMTRRAMNKARCRMEQS